MIFKIPHLACSLSSPAGRNDGDVSDLGRYSDDSTGSRSYLNDWCKHHSGDSQGRTRMKWHLRRNMAKTDASFSDQGD